MHTTWRAGSKLASIYPINRYGYSSLPSASFSWLALGLGIAAMFLSSAFARHFSPPRTLRFQLPTPRSSHPTPPQCVSTSPQPPQLPWWAALVFSKWEDANFACMLTPYADTDDITRKIVPSRCTTLSRKPANSIDCAVSRSPSRSDLSSIQLPYLRRS